MPEAIIIDWYGPYKTKDELKAEARSWANGTRTLYMGVKAYGKVGYLGLTDRPKSRFDNHEKLAHPDHRTFYLGEITTRGVGGRRRSHHAIDLKAAEHALVAYLKPSLNDKLTRRDLSDCVVIYSRFFDKVEGTTPINPFPKFPRVIAFNSWANNWDD